MGFFSRKKAAPDAPVDAPFDAIRRSPRTTRKPRTVVAGDLSAEPAAPLDPARAARARARRRLIGAVALALAAIVFVPMLFDRAPTTPPNDIALQIPDKDSPFEGRRGVPDDRGPLRATTPLPPTTTEPAVAAATDVAPADRGRMESGVAEKSSDSPPPAKADKSSEPVAGKPAPEKPADRAPAVESADRTVERPRPPASGDDPRAIAALEGKPEPSSTTTEPGGKTFAVQIAAFSAADKARGLRDQLTSNGLKSYTESVSTPQGLRTRVRLGPFPSREAADKARQKLKTMKLDGSVVVL